MRRARLPEHLTEGSFSLRASDKAGISRTRTAAKDLVTPSRGIRMYLKSEASGAAALRAYTDLDDASVLSFGSAARVYGATLPGKLEEDWRVHIARRPGFSIPRRANVVGHLLALLPDEVIEFDGVRLTSPARTWLDLAAIIGPDDLVVVGDSLVCGHGPDFPKPREAVCTVDELRDMVARHPGVRGVRRARAALERIRVGSDSQPETRMRLAIVRAGLPEPVLNHVLHDQFGRGIVWPDAAYPEFRIAIQYDGAHHGGSEQHLRDIRRADLTAAHGWREVRVSKFDLQGERPAVVGKVRAALKVRGWHAR